MAVVLDGGAALGRSAAGGIAFVPGGHRCGGVPNFSGLADQGENRRGSAKESKCGHCGKSLTSFAPCEGKCGSASSLGLLCGSCVWNCAKTQRSATGSCGRPTFGTTACAGQRETTTNRCRHWLTRSLCETCFLTRCPVWKAPCCGRFAKPYVSRPRCSFSAQSRGKCLQIGRAS